MSKATNGEVTKMAESEWRQSIFANFHSEPKEAFLEAFQIGYGAGESESARLVAEKDAEIETLMNVANDARMAEAYCKSVNHELVGIDDEQKARIAFLEKALEQAIGLGRMWLSDASSRWPPGHVRCAMDAASPDEAPELAAYLRERDNRPPSGVVQNVVQDAEEGGGTDV